jgi:hypothetical protein
MIIREETSKAYESLWSRVLKGPEAATGFWHTCKGLAEVVEVFPVTALLNGEVAANAQGRVLLVRTRHGPYELLHLF